MCEHVPHIYSRTPEHFFSKDLNSCDSCLKTGVGLWACLVEKCEFVGCGRVLNDHSRDHFEKLNHPIAINLKSMRSWCFLCNKEVHLIGELSPFKLKSLKNVSNQVYSKTNQTSGISRYASVSALRDALIKNDCETTPRGLTGLKNLGNTCYMNAAIQSLSNCYQFCNYLICLMKLHEDNKDNMPLTNKLSQLLIGIWSSKHSSLSPENLQILFRNLNPSFRSYQEEDTQEFLRCLLYNLQEEMKNELPVVTGFDPVVVKEAAGDALMSKMKKSVSGSNDTGICMKTFDSSSTVFSDEDDISENTADNFTHEKLHSFGAMDEDKYMSFNSSSESNEIISTDKSCEMKVDKENEAAKIKKFETFSLISDIFDGVIVSSVQCRTCFVKSNTKESFQDISLPIPNKDDTARIHEQTPNLTSNVTFTEADNRDSYTAWIWSYLTTWTSNWIWGPEVELSDCLSAFFSADELKGDNMYRCEKCLKLRNGVKECKLLQSPEVLCIHLKRFRHETYSSYSTKIVTTVKFSLKGLDMTRYMSNESTSQICKYDLVSVIMHHGNAGGYGHYTSYCRNPANLNWYEYDDKFVRQVDEEDVANAQAYVLFYKKQDEHMQVIRDELCHLEKQPKLIFYYVSVEWLYKVFTFAEPPPINNRYFLCPHGDVDPVKFQTIQHRVCCISEQMWHLIHNKYGGGPVVPHLRACKTCLHQLEELKEKRKTELDMFVKLSKSVSSQQGIADQPTFYINMVWFRTWQDFILGKRKEPPSRINNQQILLENNGKFVLNKNSDFGEIPLIAWKYLVHRYGGGPPAPADLHH